MSEREPASSKNLDSNNYGLAPIPWSRARDHLQADMPSPAAATFLGTVRQDGTPHAAGIGAAWHDGDVYFTSSPASAKAKHLAANPACTISMRVEGLELVLEGTASRMTDRETLERVLAKYVAGGWPARIDADGDAFTAPFSAPSAGPPPWHVFRFTFHTVFAVAYEEPYGAMKWTFEE